MKVNKMFRNTTNSTLLLLSLIAIPQAAHAANFGFVRWPTYLDMPIVLAIFVAGLSLVLFKTQMPKEAKDFMSVPKEERSTLLKVSAFIMLASLAACLLMVFVGMGLQRATE